MSEPDDIKVICPGCQASYRIPVSMEGGRATCETCQADFELHRVANDAPNREAETVDALPSPGTTASWASFLKNAVLVLSGAGLVWMLASLRNPTPDLPTPPADVEQDNTAGIGPQPPPRDDNTSPFPDPAEGTPSLGQQEMALNQSPVITAPAEEPVKTEQEVAPEPLHELVPPESGTPLANSLAKSGETPADPAALVKPSSAEVPPAASPESMPPVDVAGEPVIPTSEPSKIRKDSRLTLERFLLARNRSERLAYSQHPMRIQKAMDLHYQKWPEGPLPLTEMTFLTEGSVPDSSRKFHLYNVMLKDQEAPIPVAVEQTQDGYRVDWATFAESYIHLLRAFFSKPSDAPAQFRVRLRRAHYFGPPVPGQDTVRIAYTVEPPTRDEVFHVWVDKSSQVYRENFVKGERAGWEAESYVVVELLWKGDDDRGRWVALQRITADSWRAE